MAALRKLETESVIKTYRYLRIGMIGAVLLLAASVVIERSKVDCWQTSISAYYYTPVRAIFVGTLVAVGLALIVYKGRSAEDFFLNIAGMLAPVVAIAPTTDVSFTCWSLPPDPLPVEPDGSLAGWVVANIDNNFYALLIAGGMGLAVAAIIALVLNRRKLAEVARLERVTVVGLTITALVLLVGWWLERNWSAFDTGAHGKAAILLFVFLALAIGATALQRRGQEPAQWFWIYAGVFATMVLAGLIIGLGRPFGDHTVFALEAAEITLFAGYWIAQTIERWNEEVV